jgi:hypothetical protein
MPYVPPEVMQQTILRQQQRIRELEQENAELKAAIEANIEDIYLEELMDFVDDCLDMDGDPLLLPVIASTLEH